MFIPDLFQVKLEMEMALVKRREGMEERRKKMEKMEDMETMMVIQFPFNFQCIIKKQPLELLFKNFTQII